MKVIFAESHNLDRLDPLGSHHYIRLFKESGWECLWLGPAISPLHLFKPDTLNRYRFKRWFKGTRSIDGISWLIPFVLLFYYRAPLLQALSIGRNQYRFCLPPLAGQLKRAGFEEVDLLWCAGPAALSLLDLVPHKVSCCRIADRLDRFRRIPANVNDLQKELIRRVDFVFATSRSLYEWVLKVRSQGVYYLPNGVSDLFFEEPAPLPADFPVTDKPVAVYTGTIDARFDMPALISAVEELKSVYFLVIGPVTEKKLEAELTALQAADNFSYLGPKNYRSLPAYLKRCKVGLIPFVKSELTEAVNPIKYYEYLACGLSVAAPPMRELCEMKGPFFSYEQSDGLARAVSLALLQGEEGMAGSSAFALKNNWRSRFEALEKIVASELERKEDRTGHGGKSWKDQFDLSIVVIGRNEAEKLNDLFASLPEGEAIEWIYVDSGSDDHSAAIALKWGAKVFQLAQNSVYAPGTGRHVGTLEAKGRWILYLDGDMVLRGEFKPFIFRVIAEKSLPEKVKGFSGRTLNRYLDPGGKVLFERDYAVLKQAECAPADSFGKAANYHGGAVLYKREAVMSAGNWNPAVLQLEEIDLLSRVRAGGGAVMAVDLPLADHYTPYLSMKDRLKQNFMPSWRGKKLIGAGQVVAASLREKRFMQFASAYPYPFVVLAGLVTALPLYLVWKPLPLMINLFIFAWLSYVKRWYYYFVCLGNLLQVGRGLFKYRPFKPIYGRIYAGGREEGV